MAARKTTKKSAPAGKPAAKRAAKPRARKAPAKPPAAAETVSLREIGGRVVSIFGPFDSRALIELPIGVAQQLFGEPLDSCGRTNVADSVTRDLEEIKQRAPEVAESALAATALALALQLDHPFNSATSKSMCAKALMEALEQLRELAPPPPTKDRLDELTDRLADAAGRRATPADRSRPARRRS